jgi:hypothetical protein
MHAGHDERVVFVIVRKMDNTGGKRRIKMGKVKAFEEMLMKDVPGKAQKIMICMCGLTKNYFGTSWSVSYPFLT